LIRILDSGAIVEYFDHHYCGEIPVYANLKTYIDDSPNTCSSLIVNDFLQQQFVAWAIAGAFGDALIDVAKKKSAELFLSEEEVASLSKLGELFNYNSYGESIEDLFFPPDTLYRRIQSFTDPFDFIKNTDVLSKLEQGYDSDLQNAKELNAYSAGNKSLIFLLPDAPWARRIRGNFAYRLARKFPECAVAVVLPKQDGNFVVSIRTPADSHIRAEEFCRQFPTGGGRACAAGINELPGEQFPKFEKHFHQTFSFQKDIEGMKEMRELDLCKRT
jgi:hypothetical protein